MILAYPVISMRKGITHVGSRINLLGSNPNKKIVDAMSLETQVGSKTPTTFIFHTNEDSVVLEKESGVYSDIANLLPSAVIVLNIEGEVSYANLEAKKILGPKILKINKFDEWLGRF